MRKSFSLIAMVISIILGSINLQAEDLDSTLSRLTEDVAKSYVDPIVSGFGANLNSGWVHRVAKAKVMGLDLEIGVVAMGAFFKDENKSFNKKSKFSYDRKQAAELTNFVYSHPTFSNLNQDQKQEIQDSLIAKLIRQDFSVEISGPTIIGRENDSVRVHFGGENININTLGYSGTVDVPSQTTALPVVGLLDELPVLPMFTPQINIGTIYGTQMAFRFLPSITMGELGKLNYFGFGIQHNPGMWLPQSIPLNVSLGFFTQKLKIGSISKTRANQIGLFVSKTFGPGLANVTPYGGLSYESSSMTVSYNFNTTNAMGQNISVPISFELQSANSVKLTLGAAFKLSVFNLNIDYNIAKYNTASAGVGFIF